MSKSSTATAALILAGSSILAAPASAASAKPVDCAKVKCVALTFDDGPGPSTSRLLDTLGKHKVKVTFFVVGKNVEARSAVVRRMAREGHEIGNHTYDHPSLAAMPDFGIADELTRTQKIIHGVTGRWPSMMRPPFGDTDDRVTQIDKDLGLSQILWTGSTLDWSLRDVDKITKKVLGLVKPNAVILMHDVVPHTVRAMPGILTTLEKKGYHVVTVSTLLRGRPLSPGETFPPR
jgi:peptidoglycan/xylan/chitin deacetylase (PgdA/CDA1 family)